MFDTWLQGFAEVVYTRRSDAFPALKRYNNVLLDEKFMKLEVVVASVEIPVSAHVNVNVLNGRRNKIIVMKYVIFYFLWIYVFQEVD